MSLTRADCRGVWVPLVTPFRDQAIDFDAIPTLVERFMGTGIRGFLAGHDGRGGALRRRGEEAVVRAVVRAAAGRFRCSQAAACLDRAHARREPPAAAAGAMAFWR